MASQDRARRRRAELERRRRAARRRSRRRPRRRRPVGLLVGIAAALLVVGVGIVMLSRGGDAAPSHAVTFDATEFVFRPDRVDALSGEVDVTLRNRGRVGHELVVLAPGIRITDRDQFDESMGLTRIPSIAPDTESTTSVELPPGAYQVVCLLPGHLEAGMSAILEVVDEAA